MIIDGIRVSLDENIGNDWEVKERWELWNCSLKNRSVGSLRRKSEGAPEISRAYVFF